MPHTDSRTHNRNLALALLVSLALHGLVAAVWLTADDRPQRNDRSPPPAQSYSLKVRTSGPDQNKVVDAGESAAANAAASTPSAEPLASEQTRPVARIAKAPPAKEAERRAQATRPPAPTAPAKIARHPEPEPDAQSIMSAGLALAAAGLIDDPGPGETEAVRSLNAAADAPAYAAYLAAWTAKVERVGRLNYPNEAITAGLAHSLLMDVTVRSDGSVTHRQILSSSGSAGVDQAALDIVRMAAPFPAFPAEIARDNDSLRITRRWRFDQQSLGLKP